MVVLKIKKMSLLYLTKDMLAHLSQNYIFILVVQSALKIQNV